MDLKTRSLSKYVKDPTIPIDSFNYDEQLEAFLGKVPTMNFEINGPDPLLAHEKYQWACNAKRGSRHQVLHDNAKVGCLEILQAHV